MTKEDAHDAIAMRMTKEEAHVAIGHYREPAVPPEEARLRRLESELKQLRRNGLGGWRYWSKFAAIVFVGSLVARVFAWLVFVP